MAKSKEAKAKEATKKEKSKAKRKETKEVNQKLKPEVSQTKKYAKELEAYLIKNKLDPSKDWTKDKKHGKEISRLVALVNMGSEKIVEKKKKIEKNPTSKPEGLKGKATKETKAKADSKEKYDYPDVDGKPMTPEQKKKYRAKLRGDKKRASKPKAEKAPKEEKKVKSDTKKDKKKKKKK